MVTTPKHERANTNQCSTDYVSPLKKLKKTMQQHQRCVIDTVDGTLTFIAHLLF
jgi:hypothetical protein